MDDPTHEHHMTQADWDAVNRELEQQIERVKVDMFQANGDLHQIYAPSKQKISDTKSVESYFVDVAGIVTRRLPDIEMKRLCEDLGSWQPTLEVQVGSSENDGGTGAVAPVDHSEAALARLVERLRADPRIVASTVAVGRFPMV